MDGKDFGWMIYYEWADTGKDWVKASIQVQEESAAREVYEKYKSYSSPHCEFRDVMLLKIMES